MVPAHAYWIPSFPHNLGKATGLRATGAHTCSSASVVGAASRYRRASSSSRNLQHQKGSARTMWLVYECLGLHQPEWPGQLRGLTALPACAGTALPAQVAKADARAKPLLVKAARDRLAQVRLHAGVHLLRQRIEAVGRR